MTHYKSNLQAEFQYYPFGLSINLPQAFGAEPQPKLFTNQTFERNEFTQGKGLNLYDFEARTYDPQIGRWWQVDPLGGHAGQVSFSPYHYCFNNPVNFVDPFGLSPYEHGEMYESSLRGAGIHIMEGNDDVKFHSASLKAERKGKELNYNSKKREYGYWSTSSSLNQDGAFEITDTWIGFGGLGENTQSNSNYFSTALVLSAGLLADDLSGVGIIDDIGIPFILGGAYILDGMNGFGDSKKWTYTYQHHTQNPINNPPRGFDPENPPPGWSGAVNWMIRAGFAYKMYDEYQFRMNELKQHVTPRDNTNVIQPQFIPSRPK